MRDPLDLYGRHGGAVIRASRPAMALHHRKILASECANPEKGLTSSREALH